jgi:hypothetical protein
VFVRGYFIFISGKGGGPMEGIYIKKPGGRRKEERTGEKVRLSLFIKIH